MDHDQFSQILLQDSLGPIKNLCKFCLYQGPLESTSNDFWQMVWEQESTLIVMLNKCFEKGVLKFIFYIVTF